MATYEYPSEYKDEYGARVTFAIIENVPTGNAGAGLQDQINTNNRTIKALKRELAEKRADLDPDEKSQTQYVEEIRSLEAQIAELQKQNENFQGLKQQAEAAAQIEVKANQGEDVEPTVSLYLPAGLAYRDNVTYENFDLGAAGAAMEGGLGFAESMFKGIGSFVSNLSGGSGTDVARLAGIQLSGQAKSFAGELQAAQKLSGGLTLNPNTRVVFTKSKISEFEFELKLTCTSTRAKETVTNIIKFFRTELYPEDIQASVGNTSISLGYRFPKKFKMKFDYKGKRLDGRDADGRFRELHSIKPCYLRDVSTTYNASQMAMHSDGSFLEVDMTLNFQETRALTRADIEAGF